MRVKEGERKQPMKKESVCMCVKEGERDREGGKERQTESVSPPLEPSVALCLPICACVSEVRYGNSAI